MELLRHGYAEKSIFEDMKDGVLLFSRRSEIKYINPAARAMLHLEGAAAPGSVSFGDLFIEDSRNTGFADLIIASIYDKDAKSVGEATYYDGGRHTDLQISSSYYSDEETGEDGVVVILTDVTELNRVKKQKEEGARLFTIGLSVVAVYLVIWQILESFMDPPNPLMTRIMEGCALFIFFGAIKWTTLTPSDMGVIPGSKAELKGALVRGGLISVALVIAIACARLVMQGSDPALAAEPFFSFHAESWARSLYFVTAPFQEFLAKGVVLTSILYVYNYRRKALAIAVSSLLFAAVHVSYGITMMLFAFGLCFATGFLYLRDKNIWGVSLIHFTIGFFPAAMGIFPGEG
jgi:membrane protease YdiL (CAAX protease family)